MLEWIQRLGDRFWDRLIRPLPSAPVERKIDRRPVPVTDDSYRAPDAGRVRGV